MKKVAIVQGLLLPLLLLLLMRADAISAGPTDDFVAACTRGDLTQVELLLQREHALLFPWNSVNPAANNNAAIRIAAENGHLAVVERLLQDARVDPAAEGNYAIQMASDNGHLGVVEVLLRDPRVDPADYDSYALKMACWSGRASVVDRLLQDGRANPAAQHNTPLKWAALRGHLPVVERLLLDPRIDPSDNDNAAVGVAAEHGHLPVVELLLQDSRVDSSADDQFAIRSASKHNHVAVVERLLQDARVDPAADDNAAIRLASEYGSLDAVERLLKDKRVNPATVDNFAIRLAMANHHWAVVIRLLHDERVLQELSFELYAKLTTSSSIVASIFTTYIEPLCHGAGLSPAAHFCQSFMSAMIHGQSRHHQSRNSGYFASVLRNFYREFFQIIHEPRVHSSPRQLWQEGHFAAALLSVTHRWKRLEWTIRRAQTQFRYHPSRMRADIDGWVEGDG